MFPSLATSGKTKAILQGAPCHTVVTQATPSKDLRFSPASGGRGGPGTVHFHSVLVSKNVFFD